MNNSKVVKITLLGDIFPGELSYTRNYGIKSQFLKHQGKPWLPKIKEITEDGDIVIGNLESPLIAKNKTIKDTFYGSPVFAHFMKNCGINVLNIANNHILEHGPEGLKQTVQTLRNAELDFVGNIEGLKPNIVYKHIKGIKIAIAGFSNVDLDIIKNDNQFSVLNENIVLDTLHEMKEHKADIKILCFHWGNEYIHVPSLLQRKLAYKFIDSGANIVAGHHPHVVQPYETYKNGHIFYSLGNFIFDYIHSEMVSIGLISCLEILPSAQIIVRLKGTKLSYKNTVSLLPSNKFEKYYSNITMQYNKFKVLTDEQYNLHYNTLLRKNHIRQRALMKVSIIRELIRIKSKDKFHLLINIIVYYYGLIERILRSK